MDGKELAKQTLDQIPQAKSNAKRIIGLVKEGGRITGYQLSDHSIVEKQQAVSLAKQGRIAGVGIAHTKGMYPISNRITKKSQDRVFRSCDYIFKVSECILPYTTHRMPQPKFP
ncbi:MAG: DUF3892 domain-containing protein [Ruminococcaceae bacterium]|nr:DUF3892 domain-containing protein [Oscillospiraceae bacterium]